MLPGSVARGLVALGLVAPGLTGCGGQVDDRFAAETYDEYSQPLQNALIGTPDGQVVRIGRASQPGSPAAEGDVVIIGAGGGSSGGPISPAGGSGGSGPIFGQGGGGAGGGGSTDQSGFGSWTFDDCSPTSHFLADSSGFGANAQQELGAYCVEGISGRAVEFDSQRDVIQVPDQPQFTVQSRVAVAAWVKPDTVRGDHPIVIKRLRNDTSFSLGIHNGNIEMSVVIDDGTTVISRAPIEAGVFTHVAGMFDGTFVFLFINGQQFGQIYAAGNLRNVFAPIRIGATTQNQAFDGVIDEVFLSTQEISKEQLTALSCIHHPSELSVSAGNPSGPVPFDTVVEYDVAVTNNDVGACQPAQYDAFFSSFDPTISASFDNSFQSAEPGSTVLFHARVSATEDADAGLHQLPFEVFSFGSTGFEQLFGEIPFEVAPPTGCFVSSRRELMITHLSVVDDPIRTAGNTPISGFFGGPVIIDTFPISRPAPIAGELGDVGAAGSAVIEPVPPPGTGAGGTGAGGGSGVGGSGVNGSGGSGGSNPGPAARAGVWSFGHLMRELAPTPEAAPRMVEQMLESFTTTQVVNDFAIAPRRGWQTQVLDVWPRTPDGQLDLDQAPVTLEAIVNRVDVRDLSIGMGGEGRFVFGINGPGFPLQATLIFEFNLPAQTEADVLEWANLWHGLQAHPFPSEEYNAALEAVTRRFTARGASPGSVNGSALFSFRTNEIDLGTDGRWELRQFDLAPDTGFFRLVPLSETPDLGFNETSTFADFVNQNAPAIISLVPGGTGNTVPARFQGQPFQAGAVFNDLIQWSAPGILDPEARFHASMNTCNGCHGPETNTFFLMINPRFPGSEASLSPFISGTTVFDPFTGQIRTLNDLARRRVDLTALVCTPGEEPPPPAQDAGPAVARVR
jgi:hypothetical protein